MINKSIFKFGLAILLILPLISCEESEAVHDEALITAIIDDVRLGWENGDGDNFRKHFLDWEGARYFEGGGQNEGLEDLIINHVLEEKELHLILAFTNVQVHFEGNFAWALTDTDIKLTLGDGRKIHNTGHGTYLFRWVEGAWKVIHTQSGSRAVRE